MAVYTVKTREVFILGRGWYGQQMAYLYKLPKDIVRTREGVQDWLDLNAGDFSHIDDFAASIEYDEIPWETEDSEYTYNDAMYPESY